MVRDHPDTARRDGDAAVLAAPSAAEPSPQIGNRQLGTVALGQGTYVEFVMPPARRAVRRDLVTVREEVAERRERRSQLGLSVRSRGTYPMLARLHVAAKILSPSPKRYFGAVRSGSGAGAKPAGLLEEHYENALHRICTAWR